MEEPVRQIAHNDGLEGPFIVDRLKKEEIAVGLNVATSKGVNMFEAGIVDPTKVSHSVLQNEATASALFLTTEAVVVDIPEEGGAGGGLPDTRNLDGMM